MISVIIIWMYALITVFLLGYGFATISEFLFSYRIRSMTGILMSGIVVATVYAQIFSLFSGVGLTANIVLVAGCICIGIFERKKLGEWIRSCRDYIKNHPRLCGFLVFLFLLMAYGTSCGIIHYDTGLYHAQSIRWIEEYGVVKGLGNLHCRLAYNSASFALTALYSMRFFGGQSFHVMAGFLAFILAVECMGLLKAVQRKRLNVSDYGRIMAIYYLLIIFDEMVSPASDYFMVLTAFYLIIRWLALLEENEKQPEAYGLLCLLGVFLMSIKLSAALILLLVIYPAILLIKEKKVKEILTFLGMGIFTILPYLIRNVVISGWLVYPFTFIDLFPVDYKIPKGMAEYDAKEIQVWGRGYTDVTQFDTPISQWIGNWFRSQSMMDKLFILAAALSVIVLCIRLVRLVTKKGEESVFLLTELTLFASFAFWLGTSPLMRYGCVYVWLTGVIIWGRALEDVAYKIPVRKILYLLLILFGYYKLIMLGVEIVRDASTEYLVCQKDYENYPVETYEIDGFSFYNAVSGDQTGYDAFPSAPVRAQIELRGKGLRDGFKMLNE